MFFFFFFSSLSVERWLHHDRGSGRWMEVCWKIAGSLDWCALRCNLKFVATCSHNNKERYSILLPYSLFATMGSNICLWLQASSVPNLFLKIKQRKRQCVKYYRTVRKSFSDYVQKLWNVLHLTIYKLLSIIKGL